MFTLSVITSVANPERAGIQGLLPHIPKKKKKKKRIFRKKGKIEKECKLTSVKVECFDRVCTYE